VGGAARCWPAPIPRHDARCRDTSSQLPSRRADHSHSEGDPNRTDVGTGRRHADRVCGELGQPARGTEGVPSKTAVHPQPGTNCRGMWCSPRGSRLLGEPIPSQLADLPIGCFMNRSIPTRARAFRLAHHWAQSGAVGICPPSRLRSTRSATAPSTAGSGKTSTTGSSAARHGEASPRTRAFTTSHNARLSRASCPRPASLCGLPIA